MHQDRMHTLIGIFIVGAIVLFAYSAIFFYQTYLKQQVETYVMFFKGSLEGLDARSPITYRGVKIGEVLRIEITEDRTTNTVEVPVYVQFFVERTSGFNQNPVQLLIEKGYIADISQPNLLTGVAKIELIQPDKPHEAHQPNYYKYPVFPTTLVAEKYTTVDETLKTAKDTLKDISNFVKSKQMQEMIKSINDMSSSLDKLATQINQNITPFMAYFSQGMERVSKAATATENFMDYLSRYPESLLRGRA